MTGIVFGPVEIASKGHVFSPPRPCNSHTTITVKCENDARDTATRPAAVSFLLSNDGGKTFCVADYRCFNMGPAVSSTQDFSLADFRSFQQEPLSYYSDESLIVRNAQHQTKSFGPPWTHWKCLLHGGEDSTVTMSVTEETP